MKHLSRLETAHQGLADLFNQASKPKQAEAVSRAIREALQANDISQLHTEMKLLLTGSMPENQMAELGSRCRKLSDQLDALYFDQEEGGEPESVWSKSFCKSRAYAAIAEFCEKQPPEALYEALHSLKSNDETIASLVSYLSQ